MIKLALKTHTINYCVDLIFDNIKQGFSAPQGAKLSVRYIPDKSSILFCIMPHNNKVLYFIPLSIETLVYIVGETESEISNLMETKIQTTYSRQSIEIILTSNTIYERDIEYRHTTSNFNYALYEHNLDIWNSLINVGAVVM